MSARLSVAAGLIGVLALGGLGCASKPPPPPKPIDTRAVVSAAADVNPDSSGRPSPVVVRIYQLRGAAEFNGADFFALYGMEKETLGANLIQREEQTLFPGQHLELKMPLAEDTRFVGAIAAYRDIRTTHWRAIIGAPEKPRRKAPPTQHIVVQVDRDAVSLSSTTP
jgi:type VI secretion system protein VasD